MKGFTRDKKLLLDFMKMFNLNNFKITKFVTYLTDLKTDLSKSIRRF